jgi:hypothetical protein
VLRRNGTERRNERSNAQLSNFYKLKTSLPSNHPNAELSFSASASPLLRERRSRQYDAFVTDLVAMRQVIVISDVLPGHLQAIDEPPTLISYIVSVGYRTDVMKANLYGSKA